MTPDPEDILIEDDYGSQLFRNQLLPLWMKIVSVLFIPAGAALAVFLIAGQLQLGWGAGFINLTWQGILALMLLISYILAGITGWALLREKRWAVDFGLADFGVATLITGYAMADAFRQGVIYFFSSFGIADAILLAVFTLLCTFLGKLVRIRKEWKHRRSRITGDF